MEDIISIKSLTKNYRDFSLNEVNLDIPSGSIVGLIGENGAGKTTLISLILNQIARDNGEIKIFGLDNLKDEKEIKKKIGFVVDECCFHNCFTANDVNSIMKLVYTEWNSDIFFNYLSKFNIERKKKISEMSKGMKSKMMLSTALSHNPKLLILDEITSGLDPVVRDDILQILNNFVDSGDKSVFFSTHITSDLDKVADYIAFLDHGKIVFMESKEELLNKYLIIQCIMEKSMDIKNEYIIKQYNYNNISTILTRNITNIVEAYPEFIRKPTIDDLMLLHIKGGMC